MCFAQSTVWYSLHTAASAAGNHLTTHLFVAFWCAPKNRQIISGVFTFFKTLRAQNTINKCKYRCRRIPMFLAPRKPKTTVFTISCATGSKNNSICSVFGAHYLAKTQVLNGIDTIFSNWHEVLFICKKYKNTVIYDVLPSWAQQKIGQPLSKNAPNWPPEASYLFIFLVSPKIFFGAAGVRP